MSKDQLKEQEAWWHSLPSYDKLTFEESVALTEMIDNLFGALRPTPPPRTYEQGIAQGKWEMLQDTDLLTVNILRSWERQRIVTFAKHLLGSEYSTYEQGAEDMRERVARHFEAHWEGISGLGRSIASAIRALPTQPEGEGK